MIFQQDKRHVKAKPWLFAAALIASVGMVAGIPQTSVSADSVQAEVLSASSSEPAVQTVTSAAVSTTSQSVNQLSAASSAVASASSAVASATSALALNQSQLASLSAAQVNLSAVATQDLTKFSANGQTSATDLFASTSFSSSEVVVLPMPASSYVPNQAAINSYFLADLNQLRALNGQPAILYANGTTAGYSGSLASDVASLQAFANTRAAQIISDFSHDQAGTHAENISANGGITDQMLSDQEVAYYLLMDWYDESDNPESLGVDHYGHRANLLYMQSYEALSVLSSANTGTGYDLFVAMEGPGYTNNASYNAAISMASATSNPATKPLPNMIFEYVNSSAYASYTSKNSAALTLQASLTTNLSSATAAYSNALAAYQTLLGSTPAAGVATLLTQEIDTWVGYSLNASAGLVSVTNSDGTTGNPSNVSVDSSAVNMSQSGSYVLTYSYVDPVTGKSATVTTTVNVASAQATLVGAYQTNGFSAAPGQLAFNLVTINNAKAQAGTTQKVTVTLIDQMTGNAVTQASSTFTLDNNGYGNTTVTLSFNGTGLSGHTLKANYAFAQVLSTTAAAINFVSESGSTSQTLAEIASSADSAKVIPSGVSAGTLVGQTTPQAPASATDFQVKSKTASATIVRANNTSKTASSANKALPETGDTSGELALETLGSTLILSALTVASLKRRKQQN
ncbi:MAG: bacterial Ig-like domain-containing protein [Streptococcaceae bacterium]|jgi:hypothetical protein|nr:bacterial Ig-like domain-containing protein [Streptococcaceae bacterium]